MAQTEDGGFAEALEQMRHALAAMGSGDPQPSMAAWADSPDVTLFGAWGPIEKGHADFPPAGERLTEQ